METIKSPCLRQKSPRQTILNKKVLNKENSSPNKTQELIKKERSHLKRSKSFNGGKEEGFLKPEIIKQESKTIPTAPNKGILKTSFYSSDYSHDSTYKNNLDNHTVIGIMQVALKEENDKESGTSGMKESQKRKSLNRRVSFASHASVRLFEKEQEFQSPNSTFSTESSLFQEGNPLLSPIKRRNSKSKKLSISNNSPQTPSPVKFLSPVKSSRLYINSPIPISQGEKILDDLDQNDFELISDRLLDSQENNSGQQSLDYKDNTDLRDVNGEMTMDLTDVIFNSVFKENVEKGIPSNSVYLSADSISGKNFTEEISDSNEVISGLISQRNVENSIVHLTKAIDDTSLEEKQLEGMKDLTSGKIEVDKNMMNMSTLYLQTYQKKSEDKNFEMSFINSPDLTISKTFKAYNYTDSVDMDVTKTIGGIVKKSNEVYQKDGLTMDFTTAIGNILTSNEKIEENFPDAFNGIYLKEKPDLMEKKNHYDTFSKCFSLNDSYKPIAIYQDDNTVDMNFTKVIPSVLELKNNLVSKKHEEFISFDQDNDEIVDMDITKTFDTKLKSPQRVPRNGILAMDALFGKKILNNNMRRLSDTSLPILLGSPKAVKLLKNRKSIGGFEEMKLAGLGSPTNKVVIGEKPVWGNDIYKANAFILDNLDIRDRIAQLTPKKNDISRLPVAQSISKNTLENSSSKRKKDHADDLNSSHIISPGKKSYRSPNFKKNEYSDHLIEMQDEDNFLSPISLTDFLKMTSISFLDGLTTTKRRETTFFPCFMLKSPSLKELIYAVSLTLPSLELYQFSCKELQKYIEEGKEVVNKIEENTSEENPLLFREYITASPEIQVIMNGQFKLLKNYSRLYAKGVWYEWRDKLLLGLKEGLEKNLEGLKKDELIINELKPVLNTYFPLVKETFDSLKEKLKYLKAIREEINQCDQKELKKVRSDISKINEELQNNLEISEKIKGDIEEIDGKLNTLCEKQTKLDCEIQEYKKAAEVSRCFDKGEIENIKKTLKTLKTITGWEAKSFSNDVIIFIYLDVIETTFNFTQNNVSIKWNGNIEDKIRMFFFDYLEKTLKKCTIKEAPLLISRIWYTATLIWSEFYLLKIRYPLFCTLVIEDGQPLLEITVKVFFPLHFMKIFVTFKLRHSIIYEYPNISNNDFINVNVIYGNADVSKVSKIILKKISTGGIKALCSLCDGF
ncbi:hypothetical protein PCANB_001014 [Pneumocystis canis]|nr:hypothetical protein PCANB_001014 [Pneumocystis canis]